MENGGEAIVAPGEQCVQTHSGLRLSLRVWGIPWHVGEKHAEAGAKLARFRVAVECQMKGSGLEP